MIRELAQWTDRAGDEDVAPGDLTSLARQLDRGAVDRLDLVLEVMRGQLAAVRAERIGLDQVGAGVDEADVEGDDRFGSAEIGLPGSGDAAPRPWTSTPIPPSATTIGPVWRRSAKRSAMA